MDFGSHETDYVTVITQEGEAISQLIAGYIDILLKKQRGIWFKRSTNELDTGNVIDEDEGNVAEVTTINRVGASGIVGISSNNIGGYDNLSATVMDVEGAANAVNRMVNSLFGDVFPSKLTV